MHDKVVYRLPLGFIGKMAHTLFVKKKLDAIFDYRKEMICKIFPGSTAIS